MKQVQNEEMKALLRSVGCKATVSRVALLSTLKQARKPLNILQLLHHLKGEKIDRATIYRALNDLGVAGLVAKIDIAHHHAHYELISGRHHHHHLVCEGCGAVEEVEECIGSLEKKVLRGSKRFSYIDRHSLEFFGTCHACAR
ncbi:MAG: transcriptional repressor [Patescibacteria group bacterium]